MSQLPRLLHSKMSFPDSEIYSFLPILSYCAGDIVYKGGQRQPPLPSKCRPEEVRAANPCPKLRRGFFDAGHAIADAKVAHYHARQALTRAEEAALQALFSVSYIYIAKARGLPVPNNNLGGYGIQRRLGSPDVSSSFLGRTSGASFAIKEGTRK